MDLSAQIAVVFIMTACVTGKHESLYDSHREHSGGYGDDSYENVKVVQIPVYKKVEVPVPYHIRVPVPKAVIVRVPHKIEVKVPFPVTVEKKIEVPVEKPEPYIVKKPYKVEVIKKVPYPVPKPYSVHVPIYKTKHVYSDDDHH